jgi:hypothetical protein
VDEQPLSAREFGAAFKGFLEQAVTEAPEEGSIFLRRIREHLGVDPTSLAVVGQDFEGTDHPNVQVALEAYLEPDTRSVELLGFASPFAGYQPVTLAMLLATPRSGPMAGPSIELGPVEYVDVEIGSDQTLACLDSALLLVTTESGPLAVLVATGAEYGPHGGKVIVQALAVERETADRFLAGLRAEVRRRNVFRGQVISLEQRQFGPPKVRFHALPEISRSQIVLPAGVLERVEHQTVGFAEHVERLGAAGRHLRRGLLLHGPPGTGKTLTAMYVVGACLNTRRSSSPARRSG